MAERTERMCVGYCEPNPVPETVLPVIFLPFSMRQIERGRKTQTRRFAFGHTPRLDAPGPFTHMVAPDDETHWLMQQEPFSGYRIGKCKFGRVGQRLWTRERWAVDSAYDALRVRDLPESAWSTMQVAARVDFEPIEFGASHGKWRSPLFLPRVRSRMLLKIERVRLQRLQEITEADAIAEGMEQQPELPCVGSARHAFFEAWDSIHPPKRRAEANPWVWVRDFSIVAVSATIGTCPR